MAGSVRGDSELIPRLVPQILTEADSGLHGGGTHSCASLHTQIPPLGGMRANADIQIIARPCMDIEVRRSSNARLLGVPTVVCTGVSVVFMSLRS